VRFGKLPKPTGGDYDWKRGRDNQKRRNSNCDRDKDNWISGKADWKNENSNQNRSKDGWKFGLSRPEN
jgi:hypothetical protein